MDGRRTVRLGEPESGNDRVREVLPCVEAVDAKMRVCIGRTEVICTGCVRSFSGHAERKEGTRAPESRQEGGDPDGPDGRS